MLHRCFPAQSSFNAAFTTAQLHGMNIYRAGAHFPWDQWRSTSHEFASILNGAGPEDRRSFAACVLSFLCISPYMIILAIPHLLLYQIYERDDDTRIQPSMLKPH